MTLSTVLVGTVTAAVLVYTQSVMVDTKEELKDTQYRTSSHKILRCRHDKCNVLFYLCCQLVSAHSWWPEALTALGQVSMNRSGWNKHFYRLGINGG